MWNGATAKRIPCGAAHGIRLASAANILPGLLEALSQAHHCPVSAEDFAAYAYGALRQGGSGRGRRWSIRLMEMQTLECWDAARTPQPSQRCGSFAGCAGILMVNAPVL